MAVVLLAIHVLAAVFWVGGMAFAYLVLRPAAGPLEPPARLALWRRVFARFLPWVAVCVVALLVTGLAMMWVIFTAPQYSPAHVNAMAALGILMMLIFGHLFFVPWKRFRAAVDASNWADAGKQLNQIRMIVAVNLALGVIVVVVASTGRYW